MTPTDDHDTVETELKLRLNSDEAARLRASPWWRSLEDEGDAELNSVYFDTPSRRLRKLGISLRTRNKNDVIEQTLKMNALGAFQRREWSSVIPDMIPDPALVIDPALPAPVRALTAADLEPVFKVDVHREKRLSRHKRGAIELSLDEGAVVNGKGRAGLREVELELKQGDARLLLAAARRIIDIAGGRLHFTTKSDLGYAVADRGAGDGADAGAGGAATWSRAPALAVDPQADVGDVVQAVLLHGLSHLTANDDCARTGAHVEGVHQCRVAMRRMRSALRLFRKALPRAAFAPLEAELKRLAGALGGARDLDVLHTELLEPARLALDAPEDVAPLMAALERQRAAAYDEIAALLSAAGYGRFLIDAFALAATDDWRRLKKGGANSAEAALLKSPARDFARAALEKAHKRLLKRGRNFKRKSAKERHALRIEIKKMRYTAETLSPLFNARKARRFHKGLAGLQDGLGALNDVVVAEDLLARLVDKAAARGAGKGVCNEGFADASSDVPGAGADRAALSYAAGCVLGWHRHRASEYNERLYKEWRKFQKTAPFWR